MHALLIALTDTPPKDEEVVAGPLGAAMFVFLILAVVVLGFSLVKQLRKAQAAKDAGVYGDEPTTGETRDSTGTPVDPDSPSS